MRTAGIDHGNFARATAHTEMAAPSPVLRRMRTA